MKHLLSTSKLTKGDALLIMDVAERLSEISDRPIKKLPTLRGRTIVNLFYEDSTRTRISFEAAAKRLSADVLNFSAKGSSVSKGESLKDTALTLKAMGADAIVVRHPSSGAADQLANRNWIDAHVINAGDGTHEHPTQALLDAFTIRRSLRNGSGDLTGLKIVIVGDVLHSRVARSNLWLLTALGAKVTFVAPPTLMPKEIESWPAETSFDLDNSLVNADAVMMLRVQQERMQDAYFPTVREYAYRYGLTEKRIKVMNEKSVVMHPGPMNRGVEISSLIADSDKSVIVDQVQNGVFVRMAVLYLLLGGKSDDL